MLYNLSSQTSKAPQKQRVDSLTELSGTAARKIGEKRLYFIKGGIDSCTNPAIVAELGKWQMDLLIH